MNEDIPVKHTGPSRPFLILMIFICTVSAVAVLKIAAVVILPLTIALLLALVMYPMINWMDNHRVPRIFSIFMVVLIMVAGISTFGIVLFNSGRSVISLYPSYEYRLTEIYIWVANFFDLPYDETLSVWQNLWGQLGIRNWVYRFSFSFSNIFFNFVKNAVLVILFVIFIIMETRVFRDKLNIAFEKHSERVNQMGHDIMTQVTRYLTAKFYISLVNGVIFAVAFHFIGLEFAIVWGIIQFILNFIPTLGSITAGVIISLFALIQFWPEPGPIIMVVTVILAVNMILGNILDPKIIGEHVGISPLMVLISLAIWGWIWGFAGMVLSVPMTVIIKIICENIPILEPVSVLIGTRKSVLARKEKAEA